MPDVDRTAEKGKSHVQSVVFEKDAGWTEASSKAWVEEHEMFIDGLDETETQFRWRQYDPDDSEFNYRMKEIVENSISFVMGIPIDAGADDEMLKTFRKYSGYSEPMAQCWNIAETERGVEVKLYGVITGDEWGEYDGTITPGAFERELYKRGQGRDITIRINSVGGDMLAASVMRSVLLTYPGYKVVLIEGVAASASVVVAMAGDEVQIVDSAYMMIHDPGVTFLGWYVTQSDLLKLVNQLDRMKSGLVNIYHKRTKIQQSRLSQMMTDETWFTAGEAVSLKFADVLIEGAQPASIQDRFSAEYAKSFVRTPDPVVELLKGHMSNVGVGDKEVETQMSEECRKLYKRAQFYTMLKKEA